MLAVNQLVKTVNILMMGIKFEQKPELLVK